MSAKSRFLTRKFSLKIGLGLSFLTFSMLLNCLSIVILNYVEQQKFVQLSLLEVFKDLPIALFATFLSRYVPKFGHFKSIILALSVALGLCILTPFSSNLWFFKIWFLLIGLSFIFVKISVLYITVNISTNEGKSTSLMQNIEASFMAGILVVNLIFGLIMNSSVPELWKYGFWVIAFFCLLTILFLLYGRPEWTKVYQKAELDQVQSKNYWKVLKNSLLFLIISFFIIVIEQCFVTWLPSYTKIIFGINPFIAAQTTVIFAFSSLLGRVIYGYFSLRFSWNRLFYSLLILLLITITGLGIYLAYDNSHRALLYIIPCMGVFIGPLYPIINSHHLFHAKKSEKNTILGQIVVFTSLGSCCSSLVMGYIFDHYPAKYAYSFLILPILFIIILFSFYQKRDYTQPNHEE